MKWLQQNKAGKMKSGETFCPENLLGDDGKLLPTKLCMFISHMCDLPETTPGALGRKYPVAVATRAAWSHWYQKTFDFGYLPWGPTADGKSWQGNPALSPQVRDFMKGLKNRKAQEGEKSESQRAILPNDLKQIQEWLQQNPSPQGYAIWVHFSYVCSANLMCSA